MSHDFVRGQSVAETCLKKRRPEAMPKFLIVMCLSSIFATVTVLQGTRWAFQTSRIIATLPPFHQRTLRRRI